MARTTKKARRKPARKSSTSDKQLTMVRKLAGKQVTHLSTTEAERRIKVVQADLIQTTTRIEELTATLADERSRRATLQASIEGMMEVVLAR